MFFTLYIKSRRTNEHMEQRKTKNSEMKRLFKTGIKRPGEKVQNCSYKRSVDDMDSNIYTGHHLSIKYLTYQMSIISKTKK